MRASGTYVLFRTSNGQRTVTAPGLYHVRLGGAAGGGENPGLQLYQGPCAVMVPLLSDVQGDAVDVIPPSPICNDSVQDQFRPLTDCSGEPDLCAPARRHPVSFYGTFRKLPKWENSVCTRATKAPLAGTSRNKQFCTHFFKKRNPPQKSCFCPAKLSVSLFQPEGEKSRMPPPRPSNKVRR